MDNDERTASHGTHKLNIQLKIDMVFGKVKNCQCAMHAQALWRLPGVYSTAVGFCGGLQHAIDPPDA